MSRLYDTVEPSVIDEEMLISAVEEQGPQGEAGKIAKRDGIAFKDVQSLRLDFKNLLKIDNLWEFTSLTKLQLDNNIIEKIEGLENLVNLVWLDLSFNNIEVIEGIGHLTKLQDLTLFNNRISKIEGMETLQELQVFSIGNNEIKDIKDIMYLRHTFPNLKSLNISNNPVCQEKNFRLYITAFLPNLEFLDYRLLDEDEKLAAIEAYQNQVEEQMDKDAKAKLSAEVQEQRAKELEVHKEACVEYLDTDKLFEDMYAEDTEGNKLRDMPGLEDLLTAFREKLRDICQQLFSFGLQEYEKRKAEADMFWEAINEAKQENKEQAMKIIEELMLERKKLFMELLSMTDLRLAENKSLEYGALIPGIWDKLMGLELQLVDQLEEAIKDFERNMQDLVAVFLENMQAYLTQAREQEALHNEKMVELITLLVEKAAKNELDDDMAEDLKMLLVDKDTALNVITASHDVHLLKIDNLEDEIVTRIKTWLKDMFESIHQKEEIERNRNRVIEINYLVDYLRDELEGLDFQEDEEEAASTLEAAPPAVGLSQDTSRMKARIARKSLASPSTVLTSKAETVHPSHHSVVEEVRENASYVVNDE